MKAALQRRPYEVDTHLCYARARLHRILGREVAAEDVSERDPRLKY